LDFTDFSRSFEYSIGENGDVNPYRNGQLNTPIIKSLLIGEICHNRWIS